MIGHTFPGQTMHKRYHLPKITDHAKPMTSDAIMNSICTWTIDLSVDHMSHTLIADVNEGGCTPKTNH